MVLSSLISFLFQGFEITNEQELSAIQDVCNYVYVDVTKRRNVTKETIHQFKFDNREAEMK